MSDNQIPSEVRETYSRQYRRCGKAGCRVCAPGCPGHGPYWYAFYWEGGRRRSRYLGKQAPAGLDPSVAAHPGAPAAEALPLPSAALRVQTLGGFAVWRGDEPIPSAWWASRKALALFTCLLGAPGHRVRREQAIELLWPEGDPETGGGNLRSAVHTLRQILDGPGTPVRHLRAEGAWLALAPAGDDPAPPDWLDAASFALLATAALAAQEPAACRSALALYGGPYLPEDRDVTWTAPLRDALQGQYLDLLLHLSALAAAAGELVEAEASLRRVLAVDGCHEGAAATLMGLLAATDRRAEALRVYQALAAALDREMDLAPDAAVEALRARLVAQGQAPRAADRPPALPLPVQLTNLPRALTSFVGRDWEVAQIRDTLATSRLVTVTGPGGCGKTRLGLEAAAGLLPSYPDGVWLVELAAVPDPALVPRAVAAVVGVQEVPERPLQESLAVFLEQRRLLLVLDNCEHLIPGCAALAAALLRRCPGVCILATSQASLAVAGEVTLRVPPMALADLADLPAPELLGAYEAIELFVERARARQTAFRLDAHTARPVAEICVRLDGIPLAIELAAARVGVLPVAAIAARLDECVRLLTGGPRTALPRQQTLRATLAWSHALLSGPEQLLLRRLTIFAGGCTLEAAEAVCSGAGIAKEAVLDLLEGLVDKSLVGLEEQGGHGRYRLLETMHQFGREQLEAAGEAEALRRRHLDWYLGMAEQAAPALRGPEQLSWLARLGHDHANLRAALAWSLGAAQAPAEGTRLATALTWYCILRGHLAEGRGWLERALALGIAAPRARAGALANIAYLALEQNDFSRVEAAGAECLALLPEVADADLPWGVLDTIAILHLHQGAFDPATIFQERALRVALATGDRWGEGYYFLQRGLMAFFKGEYAEAEVLVQQALGAIREVGDGQGIGQMLLNLGRIAQARGEVGRGLLLMQEALPWARDVGYRKGIIWSLEGLAQNAWLRGKPERAARLLGKADDLRVAIGAPPMAFDLLVQREMREQVLAELGAPTFAALLAAGKALGLDAAVAYALEPGGEGA